MSQHNCLRRTSNVVQNSNRRGGRYLDGGRKAVSESSPLRILLVDDTPGAESYVSRWLQADIPTVDVRRAPSPAALTEALASDRFDVVITEAHLSWIEGLDILRQVKSRQPEHPVLMLTGQGDE